MSAHTDASPDGPASTNPDHPRRDEPLRGEMAGMDLGMRVLSYLIAGVLVYGGLGWLGDHVWGTGFLLPTGIVLGAAGGCYVIIRRYGQVTGDLPPRTARRSYRKGAPVSATTTTPASTTTTATSSNVPTTTLTDTTTEGAR